MLVESCARMMTISNSLRKTRPQLQEAEGSQNLRSLRNLWLAVDVDADSMDLFDVAVTIGSLYIVSGW